MFKAQRAPLMALPVQAREISGPDIYLTAAYWALTTLTTIGFGDVTPISNAERAVLLFVELMGVLFFGILLGSITSLLQVCSSWLLHVIPISQACKSRHSRVCCNVGDQRSTCSAACLHPTMQALHIPR